MFGIKLHRYAIAVKERGYDELEFLRDAEEAEIEELLDEIQMKRPHVRVFKHAWSELVESAQLVEEQQMSLRERQQQQRSSRHTNANADVNSVRIVRRPRSPVDARSGTPPRSSSNDLLWGRPQGAAARTMTNAVSIARRTRMSTMSAVVDLHCRRGHRR